MKLEPIIGLEIHVQLKTQSKMFCGCSNAGEDLPPNSAICPVCLGHPGTLPVPNETAMQWAVRAAVALHCRIAPLSKFDRKNYFYPDLPKGYQISQYDVPIGEDGYVEIESGGEVKRIGVVRLHVEEDAAKLMHASDGAHSLVDFNRAGTPLLEIVTAPDMRSPEEAKVFLQELRLLMRYLGVSDADMEKGHLRCDANISLRPEGDTKRYPKTEIKNINSFRFVERALKYEIERQRKLWEKGEPPAVSATRGWDERSQATILQREKEAEHDYRYFPEPDIPPFVFSESYVESVRRSLPELPIAKRKRFQEQYGLSVADARVICDDLSLAHYTEQVISELKAWLEAEGSEGTAEEMWEKEKKKMGALVGGWLVSKLGGVLSAKRMAIADIPIQPEDFAELVKMIASRELTARMAMAVLERMVETGKDPHVIVEEEGYEQVSDEETLEQIATEIIASFPDQAAQYRAGKEPVLMFFVGQLMKKTKGQADPQKAKEILQALLRQ